MDEVRCDADVSRIDEEQTLPEVVIRIHAQELRHEVLPSSHDLGYGLRIVGYPDPVSSAHSVSMALVQDPSLFVSTK